MDERKFIELLQSRAKEQHRSMEDLPFPRFFLLVTTWLSDHPWRYLIPLAFLIILLVRSILGNGFTDLVLRLFY